MGLTEVEWAYHLTEFAFNQPMDEKTFDADAKEMIVKILQIGLAASALFLAVSACFGQAVAKTPDSGKAAADAVSSSPAYAELLLRRTDLTAELESLLIDYTDDYPKVKELRYTLDALFFKLKGFGR